jgi:hypothetical protein
VLGRRRGGGGHQVVHLLRLLGDHVELPFGSDAPSVAAAPEAKGERRTGHGRTGA